MIVDTIHGWLRLDLNSGMTRLFKECKEIHILDLLIAYSAF